MPKQITDQDLIHGARSAMAGLSGALATAEADRWAALAGVHRNTVYEWTKDVRPKRATRADKGTRTADINHPMVRFAMEAVLIRGRLDPDLAIEQAELNFVNCICGLLLGPEESTCRSCGSCRADAAPATFPVAPGTFLRYLREHGLDRKQRKAARPIKPYRRFEASAPMDLYQFDITGLKKRWWWDTQTRRLLNLGELDVSDNHENENPRRQQIWCFQLLDDHSRARFARFYPCLKPNATHVIEFLWAAFRELGIPKCLYTDNDPIIVCQRTKDAVAVLDRYYTRLGLGGCRMEQHVAGNPRATGKIEVAHRTLARYFNLLGARHQIGSFDDVNKLLAEAYFRKNWKEIHSQTRMIPMVRFRAGFEPARMPPPEILDSAFKAEHPRLSITAALTVSVKDVEYQLPRERTVLGPHGDQVANPFLNRAGKRGDVHKIDLIWPPDVDYFMAIADGVLYEIPRLVAVADEAGQYKIIAETTAQKSWKTLDASAQQRRRAFRAEKRDLDRDRRQGFITNEEYRQRITEMDLRVPLLNQPAASASTVNNDVAIMPRRKIETDPALLAAAAGAVIPPSIIDGRVIGYYEALGLLINEGAITAGEFDKTWLKSIFGMREEVPENELRAALDRRVSTASGSDRVAREGVA